MDLTKKIAIVVEIAALSSLLGITPFLESERETKVVANNVKITQDSVSFTYPDSLKLDYGMLWDSTKTYAFSDTSNIIKQLISKDSTFFSKYQVPLKDLKDGDSLTIKQVYQVSPYDLIGRMMDDKHSIFSSSLKRMEYVANKQK